MLRFICEVIKKDKIKTIKIWRQFGVTSTNWLRGYKYLQRWSINSIERRAESIRVRGVKSRGRAKKGKYNKTGILFEYN